MPFLYVLLAGMQILAMVWPAMVIGIVLIAFLAASAVGCIWVLQLGWALAVIGVVLLASGALWRIFDGRPKPNGGRVHASGALIWPGLGLLLAPFVNIFFLMPALRHYFQ
jgi:hypothetical protein